MMVHSMLRGGALLAITLHSVAMANERLAFVSCPIVRDTPSVPCWLAEFKGETYYLGIQTDVSADFFPPSLGHMVLVEGEKTNDARICGGIPISKVVVSVMPERADNCQTILMAEEGYVLPFTPPRPPGPSYGRLAFVREEPAKPQPPYEAKTFELHYDFDRTVGFKHPRWLVQIIDYATLTGARSVTIKGYRGRTKLSDGGALTERTGLAEKRAQEIADLLKGAGLKAPEYKVSWQEKPDAGDASRRRVTVTVNP